MRERKTNGTDSTQSESRNGVHRSVTNGAGPKSERMGILVVDMIPLLCEAMAELLDRQPDLRCCGTATTPREALALAQSVRAACAIVPMGFQEVFGLELIRDLRAQCPETRILVFSVHDERLYATRALHAGADGYLSKFVTSAELLHAVRRVLAGDIAISPGMAARLLHRFAGCAGKETPDAVEQLSDRELEVFGLVGQGFGPREIAQRLHLGIKTVESYKTRIKDKLGLENARQLFRHALGRAVLPLKD